MFLSLCTIGCVFTFSAYEPGFMSADSLDQYRQAITGRYDDWHPMSMALLWSLLLKIQKGPYLMLLLQLVWFWAGAFFWARVAGRGWGAALIFSFFVFPFIQNFPGYLVKDVHLAGCWLLSTGLAADGYINNRQRKTMPAIISLLLLLYGATVRYDALFSFIPLMYYWVSAHFSPYSPKLTAIGAVAGTILLLATAKVITVITHPQKLYPVNKLLMHDLAGIYVKTGDNVFPSVDFAVEPGFDTAYIRQHYHSSSYDPIWWNKDKKNMQPVHTDAMHKHICRAWWQAVSSNPGVYLANKFDGFLYHLRLKNSGSQLVTWYAWVDWNRFGIPHKDFYLKDSFKAWMGRFRYSFFMRPWFWFFLNIALFFPAAKIREVSLKRLTLCLLSSSLLLRLPQFFIFQTDTDFRYFYWTCIACTLVLWLLAKNRYDQHKIRKQAKTP